MVNSIVDLVRLTRRECKRITYCSIGKQILESTDFDLDDDSNLLDNYYKFCANPKNHDKCPYK